MTSSSSTFLSWAPWDRYNLWWMSRVRHFWTQTLFSGRHCTQSSVEKCALQSYAIWTSVQGQAEQSNQCHLLLATRWGKVCSRYMSNHHISYHLLRESASKISCLHNVHFGPTINLSNYTKNLPFQRYKPIWGKFNTLNVLHCACCFGQKRKNSVSSTTMCWYAFLFCILYSDRRGFVVNNPNLLTARTN